MTLPDLLAAAMRACDHHGDEEHARAEMRAAIHATPPHLHADLLAHFTSAYPPVAPRWAQKPPNAGRGDTYTPPK